MSEVNGGSNGFRYFVSRYVCKFGNIKKLEVAEKSEKAVTIELTCKPFKKKEIKVINVYLPKTAVRVHDSGAIEISPWGLSIAVNHGLYLNALEKKAEPNEAAAE